MKKLVLRGVPRGEPSPQAQRLGEGHSILAEIQPDKIKGLGSGRLVSVKAQLNRPILPKTGPGRTNVSRRTEAVLHLNRRQANGERAKRPALQEFSQRLHHDTPSFFSAWARKFNSPPLAVACSVPKLRR